MYSCCCYMKCPSRTRCNKKNGSSCQPVNLLQNMDIVLIWMKAKWLSSIGWNVAILWCSIRCLYYSFQLPKRMNIFSKVPCVFCFFQSKHWYFSWTYWKCSRPFFKIFPFSKVCDYIYDVLIFLFDWLAREDHEQCSFNFVGAERPFVWRWGTLLCSWSRRRSWIYT